MDLRRSLRTRPRWDRRAALAAALYAALALTIGFGADLLEPGWPSWRAALFFPIALIIWPSLIEELMFRGLLLTGVADRSPAHRLLQIAAANAAFVAYHPLNHWTLSLSETEIFLEPAFLVIVAALGFTGTYVYLRTRSLWWPIGIHWATVVAWNLFLGRPR